MVSDSMVYKDTNFNAVNHAKTLVYRGVYEHLRDFFNIRGRSVGQRMERPRKTALYPCEKD